MPLPVGEPGGDRAGRLGAHRHDLVRRDGGVRIREALRPPGVQELAYRTGLLIGPLLPAATGEGVPRLLKAEQWLDATGHQGRSELRQDAAQHSPVIRPVDGLPGAAQEVRVEFRVGRLEEGQLLRTPPMTLAVGLVRARGHSAEDGGEIGQGRVESATGRVVGWMHDGDPYLRGLQSDLGRLKIPTLLEREEPHDLLFGDVEMRPELFAGAELRPRSDNGKRRQASDKAGTSPHQLVYRYGQLEFREACKNGSQHEFHLRLGQGAPTQR